MTFKFDVFISYNVKDKTKITPLATKLKLDGVSVCTDEQKLRLDNQITRRLQRQVESSRVFILCMSTSYFETTWLTLEHETLFFRDPKNSQKRFIPILLENCAIPEIIAPYAYIDWRSHTAADYAKLSAVIKSQAAQCPAQQPAVSTISLRKTLKGHKGNVYGVAVTHDSKKVVSSSDDNQIKIWDIATGDCEVTLHGHTNAVWSVAVTADCKIVVSGADDHVLKVWHLPSPVCSATLTGHISDVLSVAISHDNNTAASGSTDLTIKVWDLHSGRCKATLEGHTSVVWEVGFSSDDKYLVSASSDKTVRIWHLVSGKCVRVLKNHTKSVTSVAFTPDDKSIVSGSEDNTIKVWDFESGRCHGTLEGHTGYVNCLAVSPNGEFIFSGSNDRSVRVWDVASGQCIESLEGHSNIINSIAITQNGEYVITGSNDKQVKVWSLAELISPSQVVNSTRYTNAKIILAGDSGVGKSGLALRLVQDKFELTESTDAHWASQFKIPHNQSSNGIEREIWLWDFAGQSDYRLIHQLFMDETELAIFVFNPQQANPFEGLLQWSYDLEKAARRSFKKILVAGRCDRGGLIVKQQDLEDFCRANYFDDYFNTSSKTGLGCKELRHAIINNIDWQMMPWTSTSLIFKRLKEEITRLRHENVVLLRMIELKQRLELRIAEIVATENHLDITPESAKFTMEQLRAVVGLLAGPGIVWQLEFGDFVLLQPEQVNLYAAAVIRKIRQHTAEIGCVMEREIMCGDLDYQDMKRLPKEDEEVILRAMYQSFIEHGICIREDTDEGTQLIFPSLYKRERPILDRHPAVITSYQFSGSLDDIYATLVVRLHYTSIFDNDALWRFAADFKTPGGRRVGLKLLKKPGDLAELMVYCDPKTPEDTMVSFLKYVDLQLRKNGLNIRRIRHYVCTKCSHPVRDYELAQEILEEDGSSAIIRCQRCNNDIQLWDLIEAKFASDEVRQQVQKLEERSILRTDNESKELAQVGDIFSITAEAGQIFRQYSNSDHGIDGEIEFKDVAGRASGMRLYLQLKSGDSYLKKRKSDGKQIFRIAKSRHAKYWLSQAYPVMLVIRTSDGKNMWMNLTNYLRESGEETKQVVFEGETFNAMNVAILRRKLLGLEPTKKIDFLGLFQFDGEPS